MNSSSEVASIWKPVEDIPLGPCETWQIRSDDNFEFTVFGSFWNDALERTLVLTFSSVMAVAAHDDMLRISHVEENTALPEIGSGPQASYRWPLLRIENSRWKASIPGPAEDHCHFILLSLECTVELIALKSSASWRKQRR